MKRKPKNVVVLLSGGMDSTTLLYHHLALDRPLGGTVRAISINYGQRHARELDAANAICKKVGVPLEVVHIPQLAPILPGSSQTDFSVNVPEGRYDEESMKATVVPNRNMILLSIAIGHAIAHGCDFVSYAAHAGDHTIYPDCRPKFVTALNRAAGLCDWKKVKILRPFIKKTKADIAFRGSQLEVPFVQTWSCYSGKEYHCGKCGTCIERRESFHLAGVPDPTRYADGAPTIEFLVEHDWKLS